MYKELYDIPMYGDWKVIKKIEEGWSKDLKFYIQDKQGNELLLRVSDVALYGAKCEEFKMIKRVNALGFPMSQVIAIGKCYQERCVYMLLTWVKGESLEKVITHLSEEEQYALGIEAGKVLKQIHSLPVETNDLKRVKSKKEAMLQKLKRYEECGYRVANDYVAINFLKENMDQIELEQPVYSHGDFHVGNLIFTPDRHVGVIDFNRWRCGDPYEEFYKVQGFDRELSISFARGKIDGYFEETIPETFWRAVAVYNAYASLYSIAWAIPFGEEDVEGMIERCKVAFEDYENFSLLIPKWYKNNSVLGLESV